MWEVERSAAVSTARTVGPRQQRRNGSGVAGRPFIGADAPPPPSPPPPLSVAKVAAKLAATAGACPLQPRAHVEGSVCGSVGCGGGTDAWDPGGGGGQAVRRATTGAAAVERGLAGQGGDVRGVSGRDCPPALAGAGDTFCERVGGPAGGRRRACRQEAWEPGRQGAPAHGPRSSTREKVE